MSACVLLLEGHWSLRSVQLRDAIIIKGYYWFARFCDRKYSGFTRRHTNTTTSECRIGIYAYGQSERIPSPRHFLQELVRSVAGQPKPIANTDTMCVG